MTSETPDPALRLMVCADDYAFTPGISRGIRELLAAQRISATSVMAASDFWPEAAAALKLVAGQADIGLHITLTDQKPLGPMPSFAPRGRFPPMAAVYRAGLLRQLPVAEIRAEIERQLACFEHHFGVPPAHIDGHHHVQQLPGVREIVIQLAQSCAQRRAGGTTWVRSGYERIGVVRSRGVAVAKALLIGALGRGVSQQAEVNSVSINSGFSGAYDFQADTRPTSQLFQRFILGARDRSLVMCHPGYSDALLASLDSMTAARDAEQAFLLSNAWPTMLQAADLRCASFGATAPAGGLS